MTCYRIGLTNGSSTSGSGTANCGCTRSISSASSMPGAGRFALAIMAGLASVSSGYRHGH